MPTTKRMTPGAEIALRRLRDALQPVGETLDAAIDVAGAENGAELRLEALRAEQAAVQQAITAAREELQHLEEQERQARAEQAAAEERSRGRVVELEQAVETERAALVATQERN